MLTPFYFVTCSGRLINHCIVITCIQNYLSFDFIFMNTLNIHTCIQQIYAIFVKVYINIQIFMYIYLIANIYTFWVFVCRPNDDRRHIDMFICQEGSTTVGNFLYVRSIHRRLNWVHHAKRIKTTESVGVIIKHCFICSESIPPV